MRSLIIYNDSSSKAPTPEAPVQALYLEGVQVQCRFWHREDPQFEPQADTNRGKVLVRVRAFSCNYRDKALILKAASLNRLESVYTIGSEFCGNVVAVGRDVVQLEPGDRVMGDNTYCGSQFVPRDRRQGVPTNHASTELLVFPVAQLTRVPAAMTDEIAAAFSIGAQTAYGIVRRISPQRGERVLVMSARSNTSLFCISALRRHGVSVYAVTSSRLNHEQLSELGAKEVIYSPSIPGSTPLSARLIELAESIGGFDCVIDPFFDLNLNQSVRLLAKSGRYATCGLWDQFATPSTAPFASLDVELGEALRWALSLNLRLVFNCLGSRTDLERAIEDFNAKSLSVIVDSVFRNGDAATFLRRTYEDPNRFGKVVFCYE
jgi:NADPH:quinone reductase-like Zn-dependent oxidoreductase